MARYSEGMLTRAAWGWLVLAGSLLAAGLEPRPRPGDYPAHLQLAKLAVGADYLVRSFTARQQTFVLPSFLVIEVALYPAPSSRLLVQAGQFSLRINGAKRALMPQPPGMAAAELKYPDWEQRPEVVLGGGVGNAGIVIGSRQPVERFPGDPRARTPRLPAPQQGAGSEKEPEDRPEQLVVEAALPEGETSGPVAGYLYFPYKGKPGKIRSLELLYQGPAGQFTLRLR